jgi:ppGpp synthetase/RelA/SpoT-type nucleotidyltranferase
MEPAANQRHIPTTTDEARDELSIVLAKQSAEYNSFQGDLRRFAAELESFITEQAALHIKDPDLRASYRVTARLKEWPSIQVKLEEGRAPRWELCTDLVAARIIVGSSDLITSARAAVASHVVPGSQTRRYWHSSSGRSRGHSAIHMQLDLKRMPLAVPACLEATGVELQILTELQAAWDIATHDDFYKPSRPVPVQVRHRAHRLAAAIDLLDEEVRQIRATLLNLRREVEQDFQRKVASGKWESAVLDEVTLAAAAQNGPLQWDLGELRDLAYRCGFRRSAWPELIRVGSETDAFLSYAEQAGIYTVGEVSAIAKLRDRWSAALADVATEFGGPNSVDSPLFDRPLLVLTAMISFEQPGLPGPMARSDVVSGLRRVRSGFDSQGNRL